MRQWLLVVLVRKHIWLEKVKDESARTTAGILTTLSMERVCVSVSVCAACVCRPDDANFDFLLHSRYRLADSAVANDIVVLLLNMY